MVAGAAYTIKGNINLQKTDLKVAVSDMKKKRNGH
jgi:hypothetical protein